MNQEQLQKMKTGKGFIAALDQSGGSTPGALAAYGVSEDSYNGEAEMFDAVHEMRSRIMTSPVFGGDRIVGVILFKETMERQVDHMDTADYLWERKKIVPFLKIDNGLADEENGVQLMKDIPDLDELLNRANEKHIFGTKMRSFIKEFNPQGIADIARQQFMIAKKVIDAGLVPIIEPEVDIHAKDKAEIERELLANLQRGLEDLPEGSAVMFKITLPEEDNLYAPLMDDPRTVRVVALSGGYSRDEANEKLARNHGLIGSFSRALISDLRVGQSEQEFDKALDDAVQSIYEASIS